MFPTLTHHSTSNRSPKSRHYNTYRFGFNGQEKETEINSSVTSAEYWMYDGRLGRRWNQDPKPNPSISNYACFANNPILLTDTKGDSIPSNFYNEEGKQINNVPDAVQKMYNSEYGIKVGYNAKTQMLYYDGEVETDQKVSESAKNILVNALKDTKTDRAAYRAYGNITFGYNLNPGIPVYQGLTIGFKKRNSFIDIADFNDDGSAKAVYMNGLPKRAYNMARTFEHEWMGYTLTRKGDLSKFKNWGYNCGPVVELVNKFQIEMGLPIRLNYGLTLPNGKYAIIFGFDYAKTKQYAKELTKNKNFNETPYLLY